MKKIIKRLFDGEDIKNAEDIINKLYSAMHHELDNIENDIDNGYLTYNYGGENNKETYLWYEDEANNIAINVATGEITTDDKEIDEIFGIVRE